MQLLDVEKIERVSCMHSCMITRVHSPHSHSCMLRSCKGPSERITFPTCSQTTDPFQLLPAFLTYSRQKDGRRICHPGLSCIHCMHGYIVCKRCMDIYTYIYVKLDLLWWLTLHGRTGWSHMLDQMHVLRSWGLNMYSYGPCIHATACDLSNSKKCMHNLY